MALVLWTMELVMKNILFALLISCGIASAATYNNSFTTNREPVALAVVTNISQNVTVDILLNSPLLGTPSLSSPTITGTTTIGTLGDGFLFLSSSILGSRGVGEGLGSDSSSVFVSKSITSNLAGTNSAGVTNLFIGVTNKFTLVSLTNGATSTNFVGLADGEFHNSTVVYDPQLINRTNFYPVGNQYGQRWVTNVNAPLITTLTNGNFYVLSLTTAGTNVFASMSVWSKN